MKETLMIGNESFSRLQILLGSEYSTPKVSTVTDFMYVITKRGAGYYFAG